MPTPADIARKKILDLRLQISELERFLEIYERLLADGSAIDGGNLSPLSTDAEGNETPQMPVEKGRRKRGSGARPDQMADLMERIIREVGRPMTRGEIVVALEKRDVLIPYEDKPRYLGTIAWRNKGRFLNVEGRGYWLRDEPIPDENG